MSDVDYSLLVENVEKQNNKVTARLKQLFARRPYCKGDYRLLDYYYWKDYSNINLSVRLFEQIRQAPSFETINRAYRKLKEEHPEYEARPETERKRWKNQKAYRKYYAPTLQRWY